MSGSTSISDISSVYPRNKDLFEIEEIRNLKQAELLKANVVLGALFHDRQN